MSLALVPTQLDHLLADPSLARTLPRSACIEVRRQTRILLAELDARLDELDPVIPVAAEPEPPIDMREAARRLGTPFNTFRKHWRRPEYRKLLVPSPTKRPRFSPVAIRELVNGRR